MAIKNFDERTLTAEALRSVEGAKNPRAKELLTSLIRHLHGFVAEVRPTPEEWMAGIKLLIETGKWCDDKRNEFILMSDTLGVSMLVDFLNYGKAEGCTESTVLGPFFVEGAPELPLGADIAKVGTSGEPCVVTGSVRDPEGRPIAGAALDVFEREPLPADSPLRDPAIEDRCRLFHHFASGGTATRLSEDPDIGMAGRCVQGMIDLLEGDDYSKMPYLVNREAFAKPAASDDGM